MRELRALRGPNYYHQRPVILMELDIGELETRPTDTVDGFRERIETMLPTLCRHTCSPGVAGGFLQRVERGTWAGHVVEHIALELQARVGHAITYGKTVGTDEKGVYRLVYRYLNEKVGLRAVEMAVALAADLFEGKTPVAEPFIEELSQLAEDAEFGPSTQAIVDEAARRGIPHIRLNEHSYVQLGQGKFQRRIEATLMDSTSALGVEIAADKTRTKQILAGAGVPVPRGRTVRTAEEAKSAAQALGYPVVVKPLSGIHGRGVSTNIANDTELLQAFERAARSSSRIVVEKHLQGLDFRLLVIDGKFTAAALRQPAFDRKRKRQHRNTYRDHEPRSEAGKRA